jgi:hypothetical protein
MPHFTLITFFNPIIPAICIHWAWGLAVVTVMIHVTRSSWKSGRRFGWICCFLRQDGSAIQARNWQRAIRLASLCWILVGLDLRPWRWRQHVLTKGWALFVLHSE